MEFLSSEYAYLKNQVENRLYQYQDDVDKQNYVYSTEPARWSEVAIMKPRVCDIGLMTRRLKAQLYGSSSDAKPLSADGQHVLGSKSHNS